MDGWTGLTQSPSPSGRWRMFVAGIVAGALLVSMATAICLSLGANEIVCASFVLACGTGCWLASQFRTRPSSATALCIAAGWTLLSPLQLHFIERCIGVLPLSELERPAITLMLVVAVISFCVMPLAMALSLSSGRPKEPSGAGVWLWGVGMALICMPTLLLPTIALRWFICLCGTAAAVILLWERSSSTSACEDWRETSSKRPNANLWLMRGLAFLAGTGAAVAAFITLQIFPGCLTNDFSLAGGAVAGLTIGLWRPRTASMTLLALLLTIWLGLLTSGYPLWSWISLELSARISQSWMLLALRTLFLIALTFVSGWIVGQVRQMPAGGRTENHGEIMCLWALGFAVAWSGPWPVGPTTIVLICSGLLLSALSWGLSDRFARPAGAGRQLGAAGLSLAALSGLFFSGELRPALSEKVLFSSAMFQSLRDGVPARQLPWIDEGRELTHRDTLCSHWSAWSYRGQQLVVRHNGVATGMHSTDPYACPHSVSDLLPVLLPLVLHPDPEDVLVLGMHPPTLLTCQAWPLNNVVTLEGDAAGHSLLKWLCADRPGSLILDGGPTFAFKEIPPELGLLAQHPAKYDIVCCPLTHPGTPDAPVRLSREFARRVKGCLKDDGLAAWRLPYYDLGPEVIRKVTASLQDVFASVLIVESVPGELVFVASQTAPSIDQSLLERLQAPQCRRLLGQAGWDWSVILGRGGILPENAARFTADNSRWRGEASTLMYSLPWEISRWDAKAERTREVLGRYGTALRTALGDSEGAKAISQRLEDLSLAHQIQRENPNEPWAYRKAIKDRLQDRPRSDIVQVKNEGLKRVLHPEDQRRKDYLVALGEAATQEHPPLEAIRAVQGFETPFDPLVSLFVDYETARLLARSPQRPIQEELQHRLHTVYFSSTQDESVRNVTDAIDLICLHPEAIADPDRRWDQLNSLMQVLAQRWQIRIGSTHQSKFEPVDTERSVKAADAAMAVLEELSPAVGMTPADWALRKGTFEQSLLRPLKQHRSAQLRQVMLPSAPGRDAPPSVSTK